MHFGTVIKHVRHSCVFLLCLLNVFNWEKTCSNTPHEMKWRVLFFKKDFSYICIWSRASIVLWAYFACVFVKFLFMQLTGGVTASASYEFSYTKSTSTTDSTGKEQATKFTVSSTKTLGAHKSAEWRIMLSKQRVTVPYTATIIAKFSAELDGFLRWGGGYNGGAPNFHVNHRGSGSRPTFK